MARDPPVSDPGARPRPRLTWISGHGLCLCTLSSTESVFSSSAGQSAFSSLENVFSEKASSVSPAKDLFVMILLQKDPWQKNIHIFLLLGPNEVILKPTSLFRRARSVGITFPMF